MHTQVATSREGIYVDERILPLIEHLWSLGVTTLYSCENTPIDKGYVLFPTHEDADVLLHIFVSLGFTPLQDWRHQHEDGSITHKDTTHSAYLNRAIADVIVESLTDEEKTRCCVRFSPEARDVLLQHISLLEVAQI